MFIQPLLVLHIHGQISTSLYVIFLYPDFLSVHCIDCNIMYIHKTVTVNKEKQWKKIVDWKSLQERLPKKVKKWWCVICIMMCVYIMCKYTMCVHCMWCYYRHRHATVYVRQSEDSLWCQSSPSTFLKTESPCCYSTCVRLAGPPASWSFLVSNSHRPIGVLRHLSDMWLLNGFWGFKLRFSYLFRECFYPESSPQTQKYPLWISFPLMKVCTFFLVLMLCYHDMLLWQVGTILQVLEMDRKAIQ